MISDLQYQEEIQTIDDNVIISNEDFAENLSFIEREMWTHEVLISAIGVFLDPLCDICHVYADGWINITIGNIDYSSFVINDIKQFYIFAKSLEIMTPIEKDYFNVSLIYYEGIRSRYLDDDNYFGEPIDIQKLGENHDMIGALRQYQINSFEWNNMTKIELNVDFSCRCVFTGFTIESDESIRMINEN